MGTTRFIQTGMDKKQCDLYILLPTSKNNTDIQGGHTFYEHISCTHVIQLIDVSIAFLLWSQNGLYMNINFLL